MEARAEAASVAAEDCLPQNEAARRHKATKRRSHAWIGPTGPSPKVFIKLRGSPWSMRSFSFAIDSIQLFKPTTCKHNTKTRTRNLRHPLNISFYTSKSLSQYLTTLKIKARPSNLLHELCRELRKCILCAMRVYHKSFLDSGWPDLCSPVLRDHGLWSSRLLGKLLVERGHA